MRELLIVTLVLIVVSGAFFILNGLVSGTSEAEESTAMTMSSHEEMGDSDSDRVVKSDEEWKKILTAEQYRILRKKGTEAAFTGKYNTLKDKGLFRCAACGKILFDSDKKFDSGTGWPSYWAPYAKDAIKEITDSSLFMTRTEVLCARCDGHLGHVFNDGPKPTGLRYCINSGALVFEPAAAAGAEKSSQSMDHDRIHAQPPSEGFDLK